MKKHIKASYLLVLMACFCMPISSMKRGREKEVSAQQISSKKRKQQREKKPAQAELTGQTDQKKVKTEPSITEEDTVTLVVEGSDFVLPISHAEQFETIKNLIADAGTDAPIQLIANMSAQTFATILKLNEALHPLVQHNAQANLAKQIYIPRTYQPLANALIKNKTKNQIIALLLAANYLDNKYILNAMAAAIADSISKKLSPELIKNLFPESINALIIRLDTGFEIEKRSDKDMQDYHNYLTAFNLIHPLIRDVRLNKSLTMYVLRHLAFRLNGITQEYSIADYINENGIPEEKEVDIDEDGTAIECYDSVSCIKANIKSIVLDNVQITSLFGINRIQKNKPIKVLNISRNYFYFLNKDVQPETFYSLNDLQELYLTNNRLNKLPVNLFDGLGNLQELMLTNEQLTELPKTAFNDLKKLKKLYLDNNKLVKLPKELFTNLQTLKELSLINNQLRILPPHLFKNLHKLQDLYLEENPLTNLTPDNFTGLKDLKWLNIQNSQLTPGEKNKIQQALPHVDITFQ